MPKERILRLLIGGEENIMIDSGYPEFESHKKEHETLLPRLNDQFHNYRVDSSELGEVVNFMFEWFALHTTTIDQELGNYLRGK